MSSESWSSVPGVCDAVVVRGARATRQPDLLLEVPHGATRATDYDRLAAELRGTFPPDLRAFFFVNTDVGAPELALRVAERVVALDPRRCALVVRCLVPRTFVDCNRVIDAGVRPRGSGPGEMTPGVHAWVREPDDLRLLLARYSAYRTYVTRAFDTVCGSGFALMVHSYAPRSVDVPVDERIVEHLRAAYAPDRVETWALRASVDLITDAPDGDHPASDELAVNTRACFEAAGLDVVQNGAYGLHPASLAHHFAVRHRGRTLCLELRRDLLVRAFTPFEEMPADPARVERIAAPLADAILRSFASSSGVA